jgi:hypothetical protein
MPCRYGDEIEISQTSLDSLKAETNKVTVIACAAMSYIEEKGLLKDFQKEHDVFKSGMTWSTISTWWKNHKKQDKKRKKKGEKK